MGALPFVVTDPESPPRKLGSESIWSHSEGTSKVCFLSMSRFESQLTLYVHFNRLTEALSPSSSLT